MQERKNIHYLLFCLDLLQVTAPKCWSKFITHIFIIKNGKLKEKQAFEHQTFLCHNFLDLTNKFNMVKPSKMNTVTSLLSTKIIQVNHIRGKKETR